MLKTILFVFLAVLGWKDCAWSQDLRPAANRNQAVFARQFLPPSNYREWYHEAERCTKLKGDYAKIIWTITDLPWNFDSLGRPLTYGLFAPSSDGKHGVILLNELDRENKWYVIHEEIHDILWRNHRRYEGPDSSKVDSVNIRLAHPLPYYSKCTKTYINELRTLWASTQNPWKQAYRP